MTSRQAGHFRPALQLHTCKVQFDLLSHVADRQRTIRELEVGKTLFKEGERWVIKHQADDYKTGGAYGQRPPMVIAPHIYPEVCPHSVPYNYPDCYKMGRAYGQRPPMAIAPHIYPEVRPWLCSTLDLKFTKDRLGVGAEPIYCYSGPPALKE